jgi:hypothetical protein
MTEEKKVKFIDPDAREFKANKKDYFIEPPISTARWREYETMAIEIQYGLSPRELFGKLISIDNILGSKTANQNDAIVMLRDLIGSVAGIADRKTPIFRICSLFMNTTNEDRTKITEAMIKEKIEDWTIEGIDAFFFIRHSITFMPGLLESYNESIQTFSPKNTKRDQKNTEPKS